MMAGRQSDAISAFEKSVDRVKSALDAAIVTHSVVKRKGMAAIMKMMIIFTFKVTYPQK